MNLLNKTLFPHFPYGFNKLGTVATVASFTADDLRQTYQRFAVPSNTVIAVVGRMDPQKVLERIEQLFGRIPPTDSGNAGDSGSGTFGKGQREHHACSPSKGPSCDRIQGNHHFTTRIAFPWMSSTMSWVRREGCFVSSGTRNHWRSMLLRSFGREWTLEFLVCTWLAMRQKLIERTRDCSGK